MKASTGIILLAMLALILFVGIINGHMLDQSQSQSQSQAQSIVAPDLPDDKLLEDFRRPEGFYG